jgi:hypothetical protein
MCIDYGYYHDDKFPSTTNSRSKTSNGVDLKLHSVCPCSTPSGKPDSRLVLVSRQTHADILDLVSKTPLYFTFGHPECLKLFEMLLTAHERKLVKRFVVGTVFKHLPHKGTGTEVKKTARQKRVCKRMAAQCVKWQKHASNRSQCVAKRLAGQHTRETHDGCPEIKTVEDVRKEHRDDREVVVMLEKVLFYPGDEGYCLGGETRLIGAIGLQWTEGHGVDDM